MERGFIMSAMKKYGPFIAEMEKEIRNWIQSASDRELFATLAEHRKKIWCSYEKSAGDYIHWFPLTPPITLDIVMAVYWCAVENMVSEIRAELKARAEKPFPNPKADWENELEKVCTDFFGSVDKMFGR